MVMTNKTLAVAAFLAALYAAPLAAQSSVAVTDLAYTQQVEEYFSAGKAQTNSTLQSGKRIDMATVQTSGTYLEGTNSYIQQSEMRGFTADIRSTLLKGTNFRVVQGGGFDKGDPQLSQGERAFNAVNSGKIEARQRQPEVHDVIERIKKGEFSGADYILFGTLTDIAFRDQFSPIQGTSNASHIFGVDLTAEYSLINTKTYEIAASFSALGSGSETKLLSNRGDILPPNRPRVIRDASKSLAQDVYSQLSDQLQIDPSTVRSGRSPAVRSRGENGGRPEAPSKSSEVMRYN